MPPARKRARKEKEAGEKSSAKKPPPSRRYHQDWQPQMDTVSQRDEYLLDKQMWTDVTFVVGKGEAVFKCHRVFLAKTSAAFAGMLYGDLYEEGVEIRVPDITKEAFSALLSYIYSGIITFTTYEVACNLLYACKKYMMPDSLLEKVRAYLWMFLYPDNVWAALEFASINDEPELLDTAWKVIELHTDEMLQLDNFVDLPLPLLLQLVERQALKCLEAELFSACLRRAVKGIKDEGLVPDHATLREALNPVLPNLRLITMRPRSFIKLVDKSQLVKPEEGYALLKCINLPASAKVPDNFCNVTTKRWNPNIMELYVLGAPGDHKAELHKGKNMSTNFFSKEVHLKEFSTITSVSVPTQKKNPNQDEDDEDDTYEEDLTMYLVDLSDLSVLEIKRYKGIAKYSKCVKIAVDITDHLDGQPFNVKIVVVHHKTGRYPIRQIEINQNVERFQFSPDSPTGSVVSVANANSDADSDYAYQRSPRYPGYLASPTAPASPSSSAGFDTD